MSVLSKMREQSTLLLIIIGGALAAFVLGDLFSNNSTFFQDNIKDIGEISGQTISPDVFEDKVAKGEESFKAQSGETEVDEQTKDMIRQQAWNTLLNEIIMTKEYEKVGIAVSPQELADMVFGPEPHPQIRQSFTDPKTGMFDPNNVTQFLKSMDQDQAGESKSKWLSFENVLKKDKIAEKYRTLITEGLFVTTPMVKQEYFAKSKNIKFKFVVKKYSSVPDSEIAVTDGDLEDYYGSHKKEFEQETSRKMDFVFYDVVASEQDILDVEDAINKLKPEFTTTDDDTLFLKLNSSSPLNTQYFKKGQLSPQVDTVMFYSEKGTVMGPFKEGNFYRMMKLRAVKNVPDTVKARHILIKINNGDTAKALAKADSLKKIITKKTKKFEDLAKEVSEDVGSGSKGGDLGWFTETTMVKPFADACFSGKKGDMPVVTSQFGVHLIEIQDKGKDVKKIQLAMLDFPIEPSSKTYQMVYAEASKFANKASNDGGFDKAATELKLTKQAADNIKETDKTVMGMEGSREMVRWAYKAKKGDVSKAMEFGNKYVVAVLTEIREKGNAPLEQIKDEIKMRAIKDKKAEKFIAEMNAASAATIGDLGAKLKEEVKDVEALNFAAYAIPGVGRETNVIGIVSASPQGKLSKPIKGENGVFVIFIENITEPQPITDYSFQKVQMKGNLENRAGSEMFEALKDKANVVDNRNYFY